MSFTGIVALAGLLAALGAPMPVTAADAGQLYVTNSSLQAADPDTGGLVSRFGINPAGRITLAGTEPAGRGARGMVFAEAYGRRFAYVSSQFATVPGFEPRGGGIDQYRVGADGVLQPLGPRQTRHPFGIAIHPGGYTVYATNDADAGTVSAFRVGPDGRLSLVDTQETVAPNPKFAAVTPDGRFLYVSHRNNVLTGFALNPDGTLRGEVARAEVGVSGHRVVITPDGRFLYVTNQQVPGQPDVYGFRIGATGGLTPVPGSPFESGTFTEGAAVSPDGGRLYVTDLAQVNPSATDGVIRAHTIGPDGRLTLRDETPFGLDPVDLAFGRNGRQLYVADFSTSSVTVFDVDAGAGLTPVQTEPTGGQDPASQSVAVPPW